MLELVSERLELGNMLIFRLLPSLAKINNLLLLEHLILTKATCRIKCDVDGLCTGSVCVKF
jgi:hypothetical protein